MENKLDKDKIIALFIQARLGSTRLRQKLLLPLCGESILVHIIRRLLAINKYYNYISVLVPYDDLEYIQGHLRNFPEVIIFAGDPDNVLKRFYDANQKIRADIIVRLTGDNPLVDTLHLKKGLVKHIRNNADYTVYKDLPLGTGFEIFNKETLDQCYQEAGEPYQKEHVTPYIRENREIFKIQELQAKGIYKHPEIRLTVDEEDDYQLVEIIYSQLYKGKPVPLNEVIKFLLENPGYLDINKNVRQKPVKE